jgi:alpha-ketoglutarate-dependent taurine dioxygenase
MNCQSAKVTRCFAHQLQPQFRYTNVWAENDLLIWNHLGTQHRAIADNVPVSRPGVPG